LILGRAALAAFPHRLLGRSDLAPKSADDYAYAFYYAAAAIVLVFDGVLWIGYALIRPIL
jgi:hypothetical protein